jgi:hypothetical protein
MSITTTTDKGTTINKVNFYYHQYIQNYKNLNMEFIEWISQKLDISEREAVIVIRDWKETLTIKK